MIERVGRVVRWGLSYSTFGVEHVKIFILVKKLTFLMSTCHICQVIIVNQVIASKAAHFFILILKHLFAPAKTG